MIKWFKDIKTLLTEIRDELREFNKSKRILWFPF